MVRVDSENRGSDMDFENKIKASIYRFYRIYS